MTQAIGMGDGGRPPTTSCAVTVVHGTTHRDVVIPAAVPAGSLLPGLIRLLSVEHPPVDARQWLLLPMGRPPLGSDETLTGAGVLDGDILMLQARSRPDGRDAPTGGSLRDHIEQIVTGQGRMWTADVATRFAGWLVPVTGAVLLGWSAAHADGPPAAGAAVLVAMLLTLVAVTIGRRSAPVGAAALAVGCCWAGQAGWVWAGAGTLAAAAPVLPGVAVAAGCAALLAVAACTVFPAAVIHAIVGSAVALSAVLVLAGAAAGVPLPAAAGCVGLVALLLIGGAPRLSMAVGGLAANDPDDHHALAARMARTDRVLTGVVAGCCVVAVLGSFPAALSGDRWAQLLAGCVGLGLLLRSRVFSQVPHVLGPRIGGVVALSVLWLGWCRDQGLDVAIPVLGLVGCGALAVIGALLTPGLTRVARARAGRVLDLAELGVVGCSVVLMAGVFGLFGWVGAVTGG